MVVDQGKKPPNMVVNQTKKVTQMVIIQTEAIMHEGKRSNQFYRGTKLDRLIILF